jgi:hypothetical protein
MSSLPTHRNLRKKKDLPILAFTKGERVRIWIPRD